MKFKIPPWDHQLEAVIRADPLRCFGLFFEMGTGKTGTAVNIMRQKCMKNGRLLKTLVLCPPVVKENWRREILMHSNIKKDKITVLEKSGAHRQKAFRAGAFFQGDEFIPEPHIFVTNYEALGMKDLFKLIKKWGPEFIIADEAHYIKTPRAKRTLAAIELADDALYRLALTGTPILNKPMDIWALYRFLDRGDTFDRNFYAFRAKWFIDKNEAFKGKSNYFPKWEPIDGLEEEFNKLIYQKAMRVEKSECLDLPPLVKKVIEVEMDKEQAKAYNEMHNSYVAYLNGEACVANIALTKGLRLQQLVSGIFKTEDGEIRKFKKNPRLDALAEALEEVGHDHKVIVWTIFRDSYDDIGAICDRLGLGYVTLYGGMTDKTRQEAIDGFQKDPKVRVIIANQAAGGTGVNLTAASYSFYYSRSFNLGHDLQSEARNHRGGSEIHEKITRVDFVCPGTIDQTVLDALALKENLANNILRLREML